MRALKIVSAAAAAVMLLSGCAKMTDIPDKYKKNMEYSLGEYSVEKLDDHSDDENTTWLISFSDKNGEEVEAPMHSQKIDGTKEELEWAEQYFYWDFFNEAMSRTLNNVARHDIISKYFDLPDFLEEDCEEKGYIVCVCASAALMTNQKDRDHISSIISPTSGIKLSELDLKTVAGDETMILSLIVKLNKDADPEQSIEKMEAMMSELESSGSLPVNYNISAAIKDENGKYNTIYKKLVLFGEEFTDEKLESELNGKTSFKEMKAYIRTKLFGDPE